MTGSEVRAAAFETALQESCLGHHILRDDSRQTQKMRITINRNTVEGDEVVAHVTSADIERCRSVGTGTHTRQSLSPAYRVSFAKRRDDPADSIKIRTHSSDSLRYPPAVGLHSRLESVMLLCNLS